MPCPNASPVATGEGDRVSGGRGACIDTIITHQKTARPSPPVHLPSVYNCRAGCMWAQETKRDALPMPPLRCAESASL